MRLKEQRLWDSMRDHTSPRVRLERIENVVSDGIPDVLALAAGRVTFCELKAVLLLPKRATSRVFGDEGLNQDQRNWHLSWRNNGGRSLIVAGIGSGSRRQHIALWSVHADHFNDMNYVQLLSAACATGVGATFWPRLEEVLCS